MKDTLTSRQLLDRLVAFPTVSSDTNLPLIYFVRDYLSQHGIDSYVKPSLIGWADKKNGALGVMLDDILAGIAAAICTIILAIIYHGI